MTQTESPGPQQYEVVLQNAIGSTGLERHRATGPAELACVVQRHPWNNTRVTVFEGPTRRRLSDDEVPRVGLGHECTGAASH